MTRSPGSPEKKISIQKICYTYQKNPTFQTKKFFTLEKKFVILSLKYFLHLSEKKQFPNKNNFL